MAWYVFLMIMAAYGLAAGFYWGQHERRGGRIGDDGLLCLTVMILVQVALLALAGDTWSMDLKIGMFLAGALLWLVCIVCGIAAGNYDSDKSAR